MADTQGVFAYLADVSGHGIPAGVLMGMVKSSVRQGLLARFSMPALLDSVNAVLPSVKEPDMFVTFAALRFDTSDIAEFTLADHPPLLHFSQSAQCVSRRAMVQYPLGLMSAGDYVSESVQLIRRTPIGRTSFARIPSALLLQVRHFWQLDRASDQFIH
jgi:serine phosphatase RsbU (regulator of sigma subunit)